MMSFFQLKDQIPLAVPGTVIEAAKTVASLKKLDVEAVLDANIKNIQACYSIDFSPSQSKVIKSAILHSRLYF